MVGEVHRAATVKDRVEVLELCRRQRGMIDQSLYHGRRVIHRDAAISAEQAQHLVVIEAAILQHHVLRGLGNIG